jgi:hypothetical protein
MSGVLKELTAAGYERVTMAMVVEAYEILMGLPEAKIKEMITDSQQIMSLRIVGKAMLSTKGSEMLEKCWTGRTENRSYQQSLVRRMESLYL